MKNKPLLLGSKLVWGGLIAINLYTLARLYLIGDMLTIYMEIALHFLFIIPILLYFLSAKRSIYAKKHFLAKANGDVSKTTPSNQPSTPPNPRTSGPVG